MTSLRESMDERKAEEAISRVQAKLQGRRYDLPTVKGIVYKLPQAVMLDLLASHGFHAIDGFTWRSARSSELSIRVVDHVTIGGHVWYNLACSLEVLGEGSRRLDWEAAARLVHLRAGLHDPVAKSLGSSYQTYFSNVPFASHGRPAGTTARLDAWCQRLAFCVCRKLLSPLFVATALQLLEVPRASVPVTSYLRPVDASAGKILARDTDTIHTIVDRRSPSEGTTATPSISIAASEVDAESLVAAAAIEGLLSPRAASDASSDFDGCPIEDLDDFHGRRNAEV